MNRNEAIQILKTYPADTEIGTEYDDDQQLRDALAAAVPGFEYPDWCTRTIGRAVRAAEQGIGPALAGMAKPAASPENGPAGGFSGPAGTSAHAGPEKPAAGPSCQSEDEAEGLDGGKLVRAVLIDPFARKVTFTRTTGRLDGPHGLYQLIGCEYAEAVSVGDMGRGAGRVRMVAWIDEEGLLKDWDEQAFSLTPFYPEPLAGRVVLMAEQPGTQTPVDVPFAESGLAMIAAAVMWLHPKSVEVTAPYIETMGADGHVQREPLGNQTADGKWTYGAH
ncbi:MAG: hypothetical protein ACK4MG_04105 [Aquabacterium sp.]